MHRVLRTSWVSIGLCLVALFTAAGCRRGEKAMLGSFVGDGSVSGGFTGILADGGAGDFIGTDPVKPGRITITTNDGKAYAMKLEIAATTCTVAMHWDSDAGELRVDGPAANSPFVYVNVPPGQGAPWQTCRLKLLAYDGDAQITGKAKPAGTDQVWVNLWFYPRAGSTLTRVAPGSAARFEMTATSHRQL